MEAHRTRHPTGGASASPATIRALLLVRIEGDVPASAEALLAIATSAAIPATTLTTKATMRHGYSWERFYADVGRPCAPSY